MPAMTPAVSTETSLQGNAAMSLAAAPAVVRDGLNAPLIISSERCKGCSLCVTACPPGVLALDLAVVNGLGHHPVHLVDAAHCTSCAFCARVCPDAVFTVLARARGTDR